MIAIIDYGVGNLFSVKNACDYVNVDYMITSNREEIQKAGGIILPGVGAFPDAMKQLKEKGLDVVLKEEAKRKPLLGICLGMQMLFEQSSEYGDTQGLGLLEGTVNPIKAEGLKIPHMGWNSLTITRECALTKGIKNGDYVYFVHSFCANANEDDRSCETEYGQTIAALVQKGFVYGAQFHPEKSGEVGLTMLKNFVRLVKV